MLATGVLIVLALAEVVPYELLWLVVSWVPDILRTLFKMNTEAIGLILRELDFWVPSVTVSLAAYFFSASFAHEAAATTFVVLFALWFIVNVLFGKRCNATAHFQFHQQARLPLVEFYARIMFFGTLTKHTLLCTPKHSQPTLTCRRMCFGANRVLLPNMY